MLQHRIATLAALAIALATATAAVAGDTVSLATGATATVRANAIWFQEPEMLARWQALRRSGDAKAFDDYQRQALNERDAWQFLRPLPVKVIGYDAASRQANVEMLTPGRLEGSVWYLDADAFAP